MNSVPDVSFIIPAYNEEQHIGHTIRSIKSSSDSLNIEIVVVDNNSTDRTAIIAATQGATVISVTGKPISMLRNQGVKHAHGELLVFLDADVSLTPDWHKNFPGVVNELRKNNLMITGSHCEPPENTSNFLERYWFSSFEESKSSHLGTGHMIMMRSLFEAVGGFSEFLETGEDYDICWRARKIGALVQENKDLRVIHNDFPKSIRQFIKREAWHGKGDTHSWKATLTSKVTLATLVFVALHINAVVLFLMKGLTQGLIGLLLLVLFNFSISCIKFNHRPLYVVLINTFIYYFYFLGRSISLLPFGK